MAIFWIPHWSWWERQRPSRMVGSGRPWASFKTYLNCVGLLPGMGAVARSQMLHMEWLVGFVYRATSPAPTVELFTPIIFGRVLSLQAAGIPDLVSDGPEHHGKHGFQPIAGRRCCWAGDTALGQAAWKGR